LALYAMIYTAGRFWIEQLRIDTVELHDVGGLRFNVWTSIVVFLAALAYFVWSLRRRPGREEQVYVDRPAADQAPAAPGES
jgi:prolipoprotein diacylglyceryltransferase